MSGWAKTALVVVASTILTTISISAVDNINIKGGSMLASVFNSGDVCPKNMVPVAHEGGTFCIDTYEAATGDVCLRTDPKSTSDSHVNLQDQECSAISEEGRLPWVNVTQDQAARACERAGKRLPSSREWHLAAVGTPDAVQSGSSGCLLRGGSVRTAGRGEDCKSTAGAYDMVGNVWEWTGDIVEEGALQGQPLPDEGYIVSMSSHGFPTETSRNKTNSINGDKFWINKQGVTGVFRGGYWNSKEEGGVVAIHAEMKPTFSGGAVGFRCVQ